MTNPESHKMFTAELLGLNWFEHAWTKTLSKVGRFTTSAHLGINIRKESANSQEHVNRNVKIFASIGEPVGSTQTQQLTGLIGDLMNACSQAGEGDITCDTGVIRAVMNAANHRAEAYSGILDLAISMRNPYVEALLKDTIKEERQTIIQMTKLLE